ncbi:unnamed protein product [Rotaria sp. Silwood1]|nr:unnamed protein product [Rotaria sp. Silwood1]CAF4757061.1 unnamed protein product [Rotaria sp. Silwood1]
MFISSSLTIKNAKGKGRGVFATQPIAASTVIEISPVLVFVEKETADAEKTLLYNYFFEWGKNKKKRGLGMGYISMYNHSYDANCLYEQDYKDATISIMTIKDIAAGEELCINYNATPDDATLVWFHQK